MIVLDERIIGQAPLCDCCGELADYSDFGINLCHDCKRDNCEGLGQIYDRMAREDMEDF